MTYIPVIARIPSPSVIHEIELVCRRQVLEAMEIQDAFGWTMIHDTTRSIREAFICHSMTSHSS
jgi:hypothetical protein